MAQPRYVQRAFDTLKEFSHREHTGLTLGLGQEPAIRAVSIDLGNHPANKDRYTRPGMERMFEKYRDLPVLFTQDVYNVYHTWANHEDHDDRVLAFNPWGHLIEIEAIFAPGKELMLQVKDFNPERGTRRWNCAAASCFNGVTTLALSERGSIVTYHDGRAVDELIYRPKKLRQADAAYDL